MMRRLPPNQLLIIAKSDARTLNHFRLGVRLSSASGLTVDQLIENATRDRFQLARETLKCARWALKAPTPRYRVTLARSYYAMYHALRAVIYFTEGGDDHEAHMELPKHIPRDFPDHDKWENEIKTARYERNRADYDPYPKSDRAFSAIAGSSVATAERLLRVSRQYLARKGCTI